MWGPGGKNMESTLVGDNIAIMPSGQNTSFLLPFEDIDEVIFLKWLTPHWAWCIWSSIIYVFVIFLGREWMKSRKPFDLSTSLALWNMGLAVFSILGAIRMNQEMLTTLRNHGWEHSLCSQDYAQVPFGLWVFLFILSKQVELGDTVFIVARKRPLIFLHWYHHIVTLIYSWIAYTERVSTGRWFITMNYNVHAIMYSYYALRALKVFIPKSISVAITSLQTMQMVVGILVNVNVYFIKNRGATCMQSYSNILFSLLMYLSYFILFSLFFYNNYIATKSKGPSAKPGPKVNGKYISHSNMNGHMNGKINGYVNGKKKYH